MAIKVYQYPRCSTCRRALKWLEARGIAYEAIDIVEAPPTQKVLREVKRVADVPLKKLFNTSGQSYRQGNWRDKLPETSEADAMRALSHDGKLIKRPLVLGDGVALIGFKEPEWAAAFG